MTLDMAPDRLSSADDPGLHEVVTVRRIVLWGIALTWRMHHRHISEKAGSTFVKPLSGKWMPARSSAAAACRSVDP